MHAAKRYRRLLAGLGLVVLLTLGCNPLSSLYFLMYVADSKVDPPCPLTDEDKKKEVKVVVLAYSPLETRPELFGVDRELGTMLSQKMAANFKTCGGLVNIASASRVQKFKDEHPNWKSLEPAEIGKIFNADKVVYVEISKLYFYEPGSARSLFRGHCDLMVKVIDARKPDELPLYDKPLVYEFPKSRPVAADDTNEGQFRQIFLNHIATDLAGYFSPRNDDKNYQNSDLDTCIGQSSGSLRP